jgi:uncharacterized membrane protein YeaQ/YmgE (transglycosylase-associated protein family)
VSLANIDLEGIVLWLVVGVVAGWLASHIMKSKRGDLVGYALLGVVGAIVGGFLFSLLNLGGATNLLGQIVVATIGAMIILAIVGH